MLILIPLFPSASGGVRGAVHVSATSDGNTEVHGTVVIHDEKPPQVLVAHRSSSSPQSSCGDTDDNGVGGLVSFSARFQDVHAKERVLVSFTSSRDIDERGNYEATLITGNEARSVQVRVETIGILHFERDPV